MDAVPQGGSAAAGGGHTRGPVFQKPLEHALTCHDHYQLGRAFRPLALRHRTQGMVAPLRALAVVGTQLDPNTLDDHATLETRPCACGPPPTRRVFAGYQPSSESCQRHHLGHLKSGSRARGRPQCQRRLHFADSFAAGSQAFRMLVSEV